MTLARLAATLGLAAVLIAGCSSTPVLNNDNLEKSMAQWLQTNYGETATVSCPQNRPIKMGDVFNCTATTDSGINVNLQVTQTDNTGNVSFNITDVS
jgi:hypothetical protein